MKKLPIAISYQMQCLYCGYVETLIARGKHTNSNVDDVSLIRYFSSIDREVSHCERCKIAQVFKFIGYQKAKGGLF